MRIPDDLFQRFTALDEACIDASSMIYMQKAGFFKRVYGALRLYTVPAILAEVGPDTPGILTIQPIDPMLTPDAQLLQCACERRLSIISEDKHLLLSAKRANLTYYNALMMLNWLLFRRLIDVADYQSCHTALRACARYSMAVWEYGAAVYQESLKRRIAVDQVQEFQARGVAAVETAEHR